MKFLVLRGPTEREERELSTSHIYRVIYITDNRTLQDIQFRVKKKMVTAWHRECTSPMQVYYTHERFVNYNHFTIEDKDRVVYVE